MNVHEWIRDDDRATLLAPERCYRLFNVGIVPHLRCDRLGGPQMGSGFKRAQVIQAVAGCGSGCSNGSVAAAIPAWAAAARFARLS